MTGAVTIAASFVTFGAAAPIGAAIGGSRLTALCVKYGAKIRPFIALLVLLDLYGVDDAETRTRFERWADRTKSTGWWEPDADVVDDDIARLLAVETEAILLRSYCTPVLPVFLQSPAYNLAHVRDLIRT